MSETSIVQTNSLARRKKSKAFVLIGYNGADYHGSASNGTPEYPTVEDTLLSNLLKLDLIDSGSGENKLVHQISFQRASRTDKGVHALRNALSVNLQCDPSDFPCIRQTINCSLPDDIRIFQIVPVISSFNSYRHCTGRRYSYYLPVYSLLGHVAYQSFSHEVKDNNTDIMDSDALHSILKKHIPSNEELGLHVEHANTLCRKLCGTHSFHNFTQKTDSSPQSMCRYIIEMNVAQSTIGDVPYLAICIRGQSFMFNQIRKMVACVLCCVNQGLSDTFFDTLVQKDVQKFIPMLPANGLVLENIDFQCYNSKLDRIQPFGNAKGKPKIEEFYQSDEIKEFDTKIKLNILRKEENEKLMAQWLAKNSIQ